MKKALICILILIALVILAFIMIGYPKTDLSNVYEAEIIFKYQEKDIIEKISREDLTSIKNILDKKELYRDNPSCGFDENISIKLDNDALLLIARDGCPIIYYKNEDKYFTLSETEKEKLHEILIQYGMEFPCI